MPERLGIAIEAAGGFRVLHSGTVRGAGPGCKAIDVARAGMAIRSIIEVLNAAGGVSRVASYAVRVRMGEICARLGPIALSDSGGLVAGRRVTRECSILLRIRG